MTNAELAILSLVAEKACHGYEIEQTIEKRGMRDWTDIGFSSIYYILNKLEKNRLIESQLEHVEGKGPARKVYQITPAGLQAQRDGTLQALSTPRGGSVPFLLGLSNLPILAPEQVSEALAAYQQQLEERRARLLAQVDAQNPLPFFVQAMFDYSIQMIVAEIAWIIEFRKHLEATT